MVVGIDIFIVLLIYMMIAFQGSNIDIVKDEVDQANITASDFTAEIRGMLPCSEKYPSGPLGLDLFKAELWQWIEDLCRNQGDEPLQCPDTMDTDPYQDNLAFLYFAMSDLDKMKLMQQMGVVL